MKAAIVHDFDAPPRYGDFADPIAAADETLVQVRAAALSQLVRAQAAGKHYSSSKTVSWVPGVDGVGHLPDGRRVYFAFPRSPYGAMAQTTVVQRRYCVALPDGLDDVRAAALGNPGMSSWAALTHRAHFQPGENVLINGATGVSGRLAVQIARYLGAGKVLATGRNAQSVEGLKALGADVLIPLDVPAGYLAETFRHAIREHRVNVILDYLWGPSAESLIHAVSVHGAGEAEPRIRFVQIGSISGQSIAFPAAALRSSGLEMMGSGLGSVSNLDLLGSIASLLKAAATGALSIETETAPLAEVAAVWQGAAVGRLVLTM
ncbi:quinone oxidoreductase family protein [Paraburkholderia hayleyella]|uniref:quinone oxidoreductase family protein n=1 Tax=Paraburkholderia hayleyella TaxID=2152889 RepID=UPI0012925139|nr:zinc-binding alcohol dehydrogenase family protein [Paraburkholderia hayleyella]